MNSFVLLLTLRLHSVANATDILVTDAQSCSASI